MSRKKPTCRWLQGVDGDWVTDCSNVFCLIDGNPSDNQMTYCCYCGKALVEVPYEPPRFDNDED